jgi:hypothetical protein
MNHSTKAWDSCVEVNLRQLAVRSKRGDGFGEAEGAVVCAEQRSVREG